MLSLLFFELGQFSMSHLTGGLLQCEIRFSLRFQCLFLTLNAFHFRFCQLYPAVQYGELALKYRLLKHFQFFFVGLEIGLRLVGCCPVGFQSELTDKTLFCQSFRPLQPCLGQISKLLSELDRAV